MKSLFPLLTVPFCFATTDALAREPRELFPIQPRQTLIREIALDPNTGTRTLEVIARLEFPNRCLEPSETYKSVRKDDDTVHFQLYAPGGEQGSCVKVFLPVEREVVLGLLRVAPDERIPEIRVNGAQVK